MSGININFVDDDDEWSALEFSALAKKGKLIQRNRFQSTDTQYKELDEDPLDDLNRLSDNFDNMIGTTSVSTLNMASQSLDYNEDSIPFLGFPPEFGKSMDSGDNYTQQSNSIRVETNNIHQTAKDVYIHASEMQRTSQSHAQEDEEEDWDPDKDQDEFDIKESHAPINYNLNLFESNKRSEVTSESLLQYLETTNKSLYNHDGNQHTTTNGLSNKFQTHLSKHDEDAISLSEAAEQKGRSTIRGNESDYTTTSHNTSLYSLKSIDQEENKFLESANQHLRNLADWIESTSNIIKSSITHKNSNDFLNARILLESDMNISGRPDYSVNNTVGDIMSLLDNCEEQTTQPYCVTALELIAHWLRGVSQTHNLQPVSNQRSVTGATASGKHSMFSSFDSDNVNNGFNRVDDEQYAFLISKSVSDANIANLMRSRSSDGSYAQNGGITNNPNSLLAQHSKGISFAVVKDIFERCDVILNDQSKLSTSNILKAYNNLAVEMDNMQSYKNIHSMDFRSVNDHSNYGHNSNKNTMSSNTASIVNNMMKLLTNQVSLCRIQLQMSEIRLHIFRNFDLFASFESLQYIWDELETMLNVWLRQILDYLPVVSMNSPNDIDDFKSVSSFNNEYESTVMFDRSQGEDLVKLITDLQATCLANKLLVASGVSPISFQRLSSIGCGTLDALSAKRFEKNVSSPSLSSKSYANVSRSDSGSAVHQKRMSILRRKSQDGSDSNNHRRSLMSSKLSNASNLFKNYSLSGGNRFFTTFSSDEGDNMRKQERKSLNAVLPVYNVIYELPMGSQFVDLMTNIDSPSITRSKLSFAAYVYLQQLYNDDLPWQQPSMYKLQSILLANTGFRAFNSKHNGDAFESFGIASDEILNTITDMTSRDVEGEILQSFAPAFCNLDELRILQLLLYEASVDLLPALQKHKATEINHPNPNKRRSKSVGNRRSSFSNEVFHFEDSTTINKNLQTNAAVDPSNPVGIENKSKDISRGVTSVFQNLPIAMNLKRAVADYATEPNVDDIHGSSVLPEIVNRYRQIMNKQENYVLSYELFNLSHTLFANLANSIVETSPSSALDLYQLSTIVLTHLHKSSEKQQIQKKVTILAAKMERQDLSILHGRCVLNELLLKGDTNELLYVTDLLVSQYCDTAQFELAIKAILNALGVINSRYQEKIASLINDSSHIATGSNNNLNSNDSWFSKFSFLFTKKPSIFSATRSKQNSNQSNPYYYKMQYDRAADVLYLKLAKIYLEFDCPEKAAEALHVLLSSLSERIDSIVNDQKKVTALSWLIEAFLSLGDYDLCNRIVKTIKEIRASKTNLLISAKSQKNAHKENGFKSGLKFGPSGSTPGDSKNHAESELPYRNKRGNLQSTTLDISGIKSKSYGHDDKNVDKTISSGLLQYQTNHMDANLPKFCVTLHNVDLGEIIAKIYFNSKLYVAALKSITPTIIGVELVVGGKALGSREGLLELGRLYYIRGKIQYEASKSSSHVKYPFQVGSTDLFNAVELLSSDLVKFRRLEKNKRSYIRSENRNNKKLARCDSDSNSTLDNSDVRGMSGQYTTHHYLTCKKTAVYSCPADLLHDAMKWFRRASNLFHAAGDEISEAKAINYFVKCNLEPAFVPHAFLRVPLDIALNLSTYVGNPQAEGATGGLPKSESVSDIRMVTSSTAAGSETGAVHTPRGTNSNVLARCASLEEVDKVMKKCYELSTESCIPTLLLEAQLNKMESKYLRGDMEGASVFWTESRNLLLLLYADGSVIPIVRRSSIAFANNLLTLINRIVRFLWLFDRIIINQNLLLLDIQIILTYEIERKVASSLEKSRGFSKKMFSLLHKLTSINHISRLQKVPYSEISANGKAVTTIHHLNTLTTSNAASSTKFRAPAPIKATKITFPSDGKTKSPTTKVLIQSVSPTNMNIKNQKANRSSLSLGGSPIGLSSNSLEASDMIADENDKILTKDAALLQSVHLFKDYIENGNFVNFNSLSDREFYNLVNKRTVAEKIFDFGWNDFVSNRNFIGNCNSASMDNIATSHRPSFSAWFIDIAGVTLQSADRKYSHIPDIIKHFILLRGSRDNPEDDEDDDSSDSDDSDEYYPSHNLSQATIMTYESDYTSYGVADDQKQSWKQRNNSIKKKLASLNNASPLDPYADFQWMGLSHSSFHTLSLFNEASPSSGSLNYHNTDQHGIFTTTSNDNGTNINGNTSYGFRRQLANARNIMPEFSDDMFAKIDNHISKSLIQAEGSSNPSVETNDNKVHQYGCILDAQVRKVERKAESILIQRIWRCHSLTKVALRKYRSNKCTLQLLRNRVKNNLQRLSLFMMRLRAFSRQYTDTMTSFDLLEQIISKHQLSSSLGNVLSLTKSSTSSLPPNSKGMLNSECKPILFNERLRRTVYSIQVNNLLMFYKPSSGRKHVQLFGGGVQLFVSMNTKSMETPAKTDHGIGTPVTSYTISKLSPPNKTVSNNDQFDTKSNTVSPSTDQRNKNKNIPFLLLDKVVPEYKLTQHHSSTNSLSKSKSQPKIHHSVDKSPMIESEQKLSSEGSVKPPRLITQMSMGSIPPSSTTPDLPRASSFSRSTNNSESQKLDLPLLSRNTSLTGFNAATIGLIGNNNPQKMTSVFKSLNNPSTDVWDANFDRNNQQQYAPTDELNLKRSSNSSISIHNQTQQNFDVANFINQQFPHKLIGRFDAHDTDSLQMTASGPISITSKSISASLSGSPTSVMSKLNMEGVENNKNNDSPAFDEVSVDDDFDEVIENHDSDSDLSDESKLLHKPKQKQPDFKSLEKSLSSDEMDAILAFQRTENNLDIDLDSGKRLIDQNQNINSTSFNYNFPTMQQHSPINNPNMISGIPTTPRGIIGQEFRSFSNGVSFSDDEVSLMFDLSIQDDGNMCGGGRNQRFITFDKMKNGALAEAVAFLVGTPVRRSFVWSKNTKQFDSILGIEKSVLDQRQAMSTSNNAINTARGDDHVREAATTQTATTPDSEKHGTKRLSGRKLVKGLSKLFFRNHQTEQHPIIKSGISDISNKPRSRASSVGLFDDSNFSNGSPRTIIDEKTEINTNEKVYQEALPLVKVPLTLLCSRGIVGIPWEILVMKDNHTTGSGAGPLVRNICLASLCSQVFGIGDIDFMNMIQPTNQHLYSPINSPFKNNSSSEARIPFSHSNDSVDNHPIFGKSRHVSHHHHHLHAQIKELDDVPLLTTNSHNSSRKHSTFTIKGFIGPSLFQAPLFVLMSQNIKGLPNQLVDDLKKREINRRAWSYLSSVSGLLHKNENLLKIQQQSQMQQTLIPVSYHKGQLNTMNKSHNNNNQSGFSNNLSFSKKKDINDDVYYRHSVLAEALKSHSYPCPLTLPMMSPHNSYPTVNSKEGSGYFMDTFQKGIYLRPEGCNLHISEYGCGAKLIILDIGQFERDPKKFWNYLQNVNYNKLIQSNENQSKKFSQLLKQDSSKAVSSSPRRFSFGRNSNVTSEATHSPRMIMGRNNSSRGKNIMEESMGTMENKSRKIKSQPDRPCYPILLLSYVDMMEISDALLFLLMDRKDTVCIFAPHFIIDILSMEIKRSLDKWSEHSIPVPIITSKSNTSQVIRDVHAISTVDLVDNNVENKKKQHDNEVSLDIIKEIDAKPIKAISERHIPFSKPNPVYQQVSKKSNKKQTSSPTPPTSPILSNNYYKNSNSNNDYLETSNVSSFPSLPMLRPSNSSRDSPTIAGIDNSNILVPPISPPSFISRKHELVMLKTAVDDDNIPDMADHYPDPNERERDTQLNLGINFDDNRNSNYHNNNYSNSSAHSGSANMSLLILSPSIEVLLSVGLNSFRSEKDHSHHSHSGRGSINSSSNNSISGMSSDVPHLQTENPLKSQTSSLLPPLLNPSALRERELNNNNNSNSSHSDIALVATLSPRSSRSSFSDDSQIHHNQNTSDKINMTISARESEGSSSSTGIGMRKIPSVGSMGINNPLKKNGKQFSSPARKRLNATLTMGEDGNNNMVGSFALSTDTLFDPNSSLDSTSPLKLPLTPQSPNNPSLFVSSSSETRVNDINTKGVALTSLPSDLLGLGSDDNTINKNENKESQRYGWAYHAVMTAVNKIQQEHQVPIIVYI
eukprot:gene5740-7926_t